jgi:hypothetical protein
LKLIYFGPLWDGGTALQRARAFAAADGVEMVPVDITNGQMHQASSLAERALWRLGWPADSLNENQRLLEAAERERPDAILVDNSKVLRRETLQAVRRFAGALVYYSPDDIMAKHFLKYPLRRSLPEWDLVFTTKTYNVDELRAVGVNKPLLVGKSFDPALHRPYSADDIGPDFESFDIVFIGAFEDERAASVLALANAGLSILVHGANPGLLGGKWEGASHAAITFRPPVFGADYVRALHHGKIALCFLRKANRDRITQRSVELTAAARPMLAEKTDEHDAHFVDGAEYVGFTTDADLVERARALLADDARRKAIAGAGRQRCLASGYSVHDRTQQMLAHIQAAIAARRAP